MPDIYTKHPDIVKNLLETGGFRCGIEPRILKPRDPEWTCGVDGEGYYGDIYIHHLDELKNTEGVPGLQGLGFFLLLFGGLMITRAAKKRKAPGTI